MTRYHKALGILFVTLFGVWGCSRGTLADGSTDADRIKALEAKTAKLEEDLRGMLASREHLRKQLGDADEARAQMQREIELLQPVVKERDSLLVLVKTKSTERDQLQVQYDGFRRNIKELLGQAEASLPNNGNSTGIASQPASLSPESGGGGN